MVNRTQSARFANLRSQAEIDSEDRRARQEALTVALAHFLILLGIGIVMVISLVVIYGAVQDRIALFLPVGDLLHP